MINRIIICSLNALILLFAHLIYFNANWSIPLEVEMMTLINKTENFLLKEGRFKDSSFLFINTAYDNTLLRIEMEDGDSGNIVVTDRSLLTRFFKIMADQDNNHKYILCDLLFDKPSAQDAKLATELNRVQNIILPSIGAVEAPNEMKLVLTKKTADAEYVTFEGMVFKIRLFSQEKHSKTLPLQMYEDCHTGQKSTVGFLGLWRGSHYIPYAIYPRYFFNRHQIEKHELRLSQAVKLLEMDQSLFYNSSFKNRMIIIGDFSNNADRHPTLLGQYVPGSIILFNTYLTLEAGYHLHSWLWFVFVMVCFSSLTYYKLYHKSTISSTKWAIVLNFLKLSGLCILLSFISNLFFGIHTTILPMIVYFETLSFFKKTLI